MRVRVSLRTAARHRSVRRRVRTGSTRRGSCPSERRRGAYASSNRFPLFGSALFGSAPPVAYRSGSRRVHSYRPPARRAAYRRVRASRFRHRRAASSLTVGSRGEPCSYRDRRVPSPEGGVLRAPVRLVRAVVKAACRVTAGLVALDLRSGVGGVASVRAGGALNPARAGCPGPLACVPLVAPPASVERRVRLEVVVERISQAWHAGPPVGSHATATRQPAVGLVVPIGSGIGSRPVRWRCGPAPIGAAIGGAITRTTAERSTRRAPCRPLGLFAQGGCGQAVETDPQRENRPRAENALRPRFMRPKGRFPIPVCPPLG